MGLDAQSSSWPEWARPVYNLGLPGEGVLVVRRYLQHVVAQERPQTVILGLEFWDFLSPKKSKEPDYESRLVVAGDGSQNRNLVHQRAHDVVFAALSLDALIDSFDTVLGNIEADSANTTSGNVDPFYYRKQISKVGGYPPVVLTDMSYSYVYRDSAFDPSVWADVREIMSLCDENGIHLIVILDPTHVDELEVTDLSGKWAALENWKREITKMVAEHAISNSRAPAELWDFLDYDPYTTESVPYSRRPLRWFWTPSHYNHALGDLIIKRIMGAGAESLGVRLTPDNLEEHLAEVRRARAIYRSRQPEDVERVERLYAVAR
jgi:hypothetical protein